METKDEKTRQEMIATALKQVKSWLDNNIQITTDFSHPQVYTMLGLTPAQGTAREKSSWRPTGQEDYVYDKTILKKIYNGVMLLLHPDKRGDDIDIADVKRMLFICGWANTHLCGSHLTNEQARFNRAQYFEDFKNGEFTSKNAIDMYNQRFAVSDAPALFV